MQATKKALVPRVLLKLKPTTKHKSANGSDKRPNRSFFGVKQVRLYCIISVSTIHIFYGILCDHLLKRSKRPYLFNMTFHCVLIVLCSNRCRSMQCPLRSVALKKRLLWPIVSGATDFQGFVSFGPAFQLRRRNSTGHERHASTAFPPLWHLLC